MRNGRQLVNSFVLSFLGMLLFNGWLIAQETAGNNNNNEIEELRKEIHTLKKTNDSIMSQMRHLESIENSLNESKKNVYDSYKRSYDALENISDTVFRVLVFVFVSLFGGAGYYLFTMGKIKKKASREIKETVNSIASDIKIKANEQLENIGLKPDQYELNYSELVFSINQQRKILELDIEDSAEIALSYFIGQRTEDELVILKLSEKIRIYTNYRHVALACMAIIVSKAAKNIKDSAGEKLVKMSHSENEDEANIARNILAKLKEIYDIDLTL